MATVVTASLRCMFLQKDYASIDARLCDNFVQVDFFYAMCRHRLLTFSARKLLQDESRVL